MTAPPARQLSQTEFVGIVAMIIAMLAFAVDAMLPAIDEIGEALSPDDLNKAQLVITSFVLGMGIGTFFTGPLSDSFGRKTVIFSGVALYIIGAALAWISSSLELMLAARFIQGAGAAAPRVVAIAMVRDLYAGRKMAQITSFVFLVFSLVPAFAPSFGALIMGAFGWRSIFFVFIIFALCASAWMALRQPETLPLDRRRPFRFAPLLAGAKEVLGNRTVRFSIAVQSMGLGLLFATLSSCQQIFDQGYDRGDSFPLWFGLIALIASTASAVNAALVERLGMRFMITVAFGGQIAISLVMALLWSTGGMPEGLDFALMVAWVCSIFFVIGLTLGNINALAMEHMGHLAGLTASVVGALATVAAVGFAVPIGLAFNGTPVPLAWSAFALTLAAFALMRWLGPAHETLEGET